MNIVEIDCGVNSEVINAIQEQEDTCCRCIVLFGSKSKTLSITASCRI